MAAADEKYDIQLTDYGEGAKDGFQEGYIAAAMKYSQPAPPTPVEGNKDFMTELEKETDKRNHGYSNPEYIKKFNDGAWWAWNFYRAYDYGLNAVISHLEEQVKELQENNPAISVWKEIEEELIECYEDYPAMNAEQDARKKIDEWKAKSQQEMQGRKGAAWVEDSNRPEVTWRGAVKTGRPDGTTALKLASLTNDGWLIDDRVFKEWVTHWLSDSPAPEQVDVIEYSEWVARNVKPYGTQLEYKGKLYHARQLLELYKQQNKQA